MKKRRVFWAIAFGAMLAITGCGDDGGSGSGGSAGSGGSGGSSGTGGGTGGGSGGSFCETLCNACGMDVMAQCLSACDQQLEALEGIVDLDGCPSELSAFGSCLESNGCDNDLCADEEDAWIMCLVGAAF